MKSNPLPKKSLGQHWLHDIDALTAMSDAAEVGPDDTVLEIGPGLGTLTEVLVKRAKAVVAVEFDESLAKALPGKVSAKNLSVQQNDILRFDLTTLPKNYKIVANIPYYLTSNLIRTISESMNPPSIAALLVQKEVAERVAAKPGGMSLLSVSAQFYWEVDKGRVVGAELFTPPPKVDSQILLLRRRKEQLYPGTDIQLFFQVVKAGFSSRRKMLLNSLSAGLRINKYEAGDLLVKAGIQPDQRPQSLSLPQWHNLYLAYKPKHIADSPTLSEA
jgi:16S rRNA (adenine1518-N6/adenine1519-N6)-dimethyltransferase